MACRFDSGRGYKIGGGHKRQCKSVPTGDVQQDCKRTDALTQKPIAGPPTILRTGPIPGNLIQCFVDTERFQKYYQSGPHFRIENPNPAWALKRGMVWDRGDCVIRALANAISCLWVESFDYLTAKARRDFNVPNDGPGFRRWIVEDGAIWTHCPAVKGKKRMTVKEFAETHPKGRYVISIANHETACVDGVILDAWNCGHKAVVGYFDMANFKL